MRRAKRKSKSSPAHGNAQSEKQRPETTAQAEDHDQEQKQVAAVAKKDWLPVAGILLPVVINFGTFAAGVFFQHQYNLSMLIVFLSVVALLFLAYILLRRNLWAGERYRGPLRIYTCTAGAVALALFLASVSLEQKRWSEAQVQTVEGGEKGRAVSDSSDARKVFTIRELNLAMFPVYPQPLLYAYDYSSYVVDSPRVRYVAPVGLALNLEVVNDRATATKVRSYAVDLENDEGGWTQVNRLPMSEPRDIYFAEGDGLEDCFKFDFKPNIFDSVARQKNLSPGESLDGWMFFEWPSELRENRRLRNVRVRMENSQGETEEAVLKILPGDDRAGSDSINAGTFGVKDLRANLSKLVVRPFSGE